MKRKLPDNKAITDKANKRIHKRFPILETPIKEYMTKEIIEVLIEEGYILVEEG